MMMTMGSEISLYSIRMCRGAALPGEFWWLTDGTKWTIFGMVWLPRRGGLVDWVSTGIVQTKEHKGACGGWLR